MPGERPRKSDYEPIAPDAVPAGIKWKPAVGRSGATRAFVSMFGAQYRLERVLETGEVTYYKRKGDEPPPATPKEKIDAEPTRGHQVRYRTGATCWFVESGRWFLVKVVKRSTGPDRITIRPEARLCADKLTPWTWGDALEFPAAPNNRLFRMLRPLKDRYL